MSLPSAESFWTFEGIPDRKVIGRQVPRAPLAVGHETPRPLDGAGSRSGARSSSNVYVPPSARPPKFRPVDCDAALQ
jgi:hypothetical protein